MDTVNAALFLDMCNDLPPAEALVALKADADKANAHWPQYKGHWDDWALARTKKAIRSKMGLAFEKGDFCLIRMTPDPVRQESPLPAWLQPKFPPKRSPRETVTVYSTRTGIDTSVWAKDVEIIRV